MKTLKCESCNKFYEYDGDNEDDGLCEDCLFARDWTEAACYDFMKDEEN